MKKKSIIEKTVYAIKQLPEAKAEEISDFADFLMKQYESQKLTNNIQQLASESKAFDFLHEEEDIYKVSDLKEVYNAKG